MGYTARQRAIETAVLGVWLALVVAAAGRLVAIGPDPLRIGLALAAGWLAADFLSGLAHWACDTWGSTDWPVLGNGVIRGFREHHVDPEEITRHDFVETNGAVALVTLPLPAIALAIPTAGGGFVPCVLLSLSAWLLLTNQFHRWAHETRPPLAVRVLQRLGVILRPAHHAIHHARPFDRYYCITTGWLDRPLQAAGFFRAVERRISRWTGAIPRGHERAGPRPGLAPRNAPRTP